ncbi:MAG: hypothetical protein ACOC7P_03100 [Chloroflexota bacterium]
MSNTVETATGWYKPQGHSPPIGICTFEGIRDSLEDLCSGGVYPRLFCGAGAGGYMTRPYEDDTRAPIRPLASSKIVIPFFWLLVVGGKTFFPIVFAPGLLLPYFFHTDFPQILKYSPEGIDKPVFFKYKL